MNKTRIMVVEDEAIVSLDLQNRLQALGHEVVATVTSGEAAIKKTEEVSPDLILMDINLGGNIDGIEAAKEIHERFQTPVIYLTACNDEKTLQRLKLTEPFGYIIKPFEERELHGHIEIAIHKHHTEKTLRESEERYSLATKGANDGLWDWNLETNEIYFSSRWESLLGYAPGEISQDPNEWFNRVHPGDRERVNKEIAKFLEGNSHNFQTEYRILHKEGNYRWMLSRGFGSRNPNGKVSRIAGSQTDITERKLYDPLTGLPNRALFMDRLERLIGPASPQKDFSFAVLVLKLDAFRRVNEGLGYSIGDKLLAQLIQRLQNCLHQQDTVVSLGEDTFAVLLEKIDSVTDATRVANRLQEALGHPFHVESHEVYTTITIGVALSGTGYNHPDDFLSDAQTAMYRAQDLDNGRCEVFDPVMRAQAVASLNLETRLQKALEREEFLLHYQPIVAIEDGRLMGFEALVRWQPQDGSIIPPNEFIPQAEKTGLIVSLERWVLWKACSQLRTWQLLAPDSELTISVNFSPTQWHQPDLVPMLQETLLQTGVHGRNLKLEITESTFLKNTETLSLSLKEIRDLHIQLHMDDFGTGYSSLSYLRHFPIDVLKIDRSFIRSLEVNSKAKQIVKAITNLGQNLQMKVTAEGVEHPEQLRELQSLKCDYGQGYLFSRPLDSETAERLVFGECFWQKAFQVGPALSDSKGEGENPGDHGLPNG